MKLVPFNYAPHHVGGLKELHHGCHEPLRVAVAAGERVDVHLACLGPRVDAQVRLAQQTHQRERARRAEAVRHVAETRHSRGREPRRELDAKRALGVARVRRLQHVDLHARQVCDD